MAEAAQPITKSPKTDSQMRSVLHRLSQAVETLVTELGDLEDVFILTGSGGGAVSASDVLYASGDGEVDQAQATTAAKSRVVGIAQNGAAMGEDVIYLTVGVAEMTGLTAGAIYYLSAVTPGAIVSTPDASAGEYIVPVGRALSTTQLLFIPSIRVLL